MSITEDGILCQVSIDYMIWKKFLICSFSHVFLPYYVGVVRQARGRDDQILSRKTKFRIFQLLFYGSLLARNCVYYFLKRCKSWWIRRHQLLYDMLHELNLRCAKVDENVEKLVTRLHIRA
mmetsp:Transcript_11118/g.16667  ORF Transcript_11118/g.16667 Transcript_11118/m.16667 type:complete len:121 (+) Transcript_11118:1550-1912(+)